MPSAAVKTGSFYQWSATEPPIVRSRAEVKAPPPELAPLPSPPGRLTDRLTAKLSELRNAGFAVLWIDATVEDLTTLLIEGGEDAILLDPDPARDVAWYGGCRIKHATQPGVRVFLEGEVENEVSCHIV